MFELASPRLRATFSPLGARLVSLFVDGVDVVAGGGTDEQFLAGDWTAGAVCGRYAGRISHARFSLDGQEHKLTPNLGEHQLHGGQDNFAIRHWNVDATKDVIRFTTHSPDGDQGFPGALDVSATYTLTGSTLALDLEARATKPTVLNLTNHGYWNLGGAALDHEMQINAESFLPLNELLLPSGEIKSVAGTRWDFRSLRKVAEPYDNCWALTGKRGDLRHGLTLSSGKRRMEVWTSECAIQMYTALHWNESFPGKNGPLQQHAAIAIEPQNFPDAPNHENFPSAALRPGEIYRNRMEWRFP